MSFMTFYQTKSLFRGAETWTKPNGMVGVSLRLYEHFVIRGPALGYEVFTHKDSPHKLDFGIRYIDDGEPLIRFSDSEESFRNKRKGALESSASYRYKFGFKNLFYVGGSLSRDWIAYKSQYYELNVGAPVIIFTKLNLSYGFGSLKTNTYNYGEGAKSGSGFFKYGLSHVMPYVPWEGIIIWSWDRSKVISSENRNANYVRGDGDYTQFSVRLIWNFS
ncbi:MAG: hypothetical protein ACPGJV_14665 [Bacteriovoracaceae bacterium]